MKKRNIFFIIPLLLPLISLRAQNSIGLEGGISSNTLNTNISNRSSTSLTGARGFNLGIPIQYEWLPWLYVKATPGMITKGYSLDRTDSLAGEFERFNNTYLQIPIGLSLVYGGRLRASFDPGIYLGYWLSGRTKGAQANIFGIIDSTNSSGQTTESFQLNSYDEHYHFDSRRDDRWEFGWVLGLGLQYRLTDKYWVTANGKYYQSLTSQEKAGSNPIPQYNQTWTFSIGGLWAFGKK